MTATPLPPLPPMFGVTDDDVRPGGRSMLDLLVEDHHQLRQLCALLADGYDHSVQDVLIATASRHLSAEEQYLYPTARTVLPDGGSVADHEIVADAELLNTLRRLRATAPDHESHDVLVESVGSQVRRHAQRTARDIFPALRERCSTNELIRLGNRVQVAREAAPTRPHPGTPHTPPLNKVVDPAVGVLDKVRDALTGRTTWPQDLVR